MPISNMYLQPRLSVIFWMTMSALRLHIDAPVGRTELVLAKQSNTIPVGRGIEGRRTSNEVCRQNRVLRLAGFNTTF